MDFHAKWNKVVAWYKKNYDAQELDVKEFWLGIFSDFLGYEKDNNEILRKGKSELDEDYKAVPDFTLIRDGKPVFIANVKPNGLHFKQDMELQLFSFLKQMKIKIGILIWLSRGCKKSLASFKFI